MKLGNFSHFNINIRKKNVFIIHKEIHIECYQIKSILLIDFSTSTIWKFEC